MTSNLDAYEQWMVQSNLDHIAAGEDPITVIASLRANGYDRIADAVEGTTARPADRGLEMFSSQLIIDADEGQHGWEIVVRFGPDDMVIGWTDLDDTELLTLAPSIGAAVVEAILAERDTVRRES